MSNIFQLVRKNVLCALIFLYVPLFAGQEPLPVYLTWQNDPSTTMTIQWLSPPETLEAQVQYQKVGENQWAVVQGVCKPLPLQAPYNINVLELQKLEPDSKYRFKIKNSKDEYYFRTAPENLSETLRFAVGGDIYHDDFEQFEAMTKQVALHDPRFVLMGGDLAYSSSKNNDDFDRWFTFLSVLSKELEDSSGCKIPFLVAIGNHEVMSSKFAQGTDRAPFFYSLFAMPGLQGYNVLRFSDYMSIAILDSGHVNPIAGKQTEWLKSELQKQANILHRFVLYHVSAFPSVTYFRHSVRSRDIRRHWVPLFEQYGIHTVFESHDHAYKRTYPLVNESHVRDGVVYFGDGSWGAKPRKVKPASRTTYLAKSESRYQFLRVDISKTRREFAAITETGEVIDEYEQDVN